MILNGICGVDTRCYQEDIISFILMVKVFYELISPYHTHM